MIEFKNGDRIQVIKDVQNRDCSIMLARVGDIGTVFGKVSKRLIRVIFDEPNPARVFKKELNMYADEIELLEEQIEVSLDSATVESLL